MNCAHHAQRYIDDRVRGFVLVSAIFLLLVLSTLGAALLNISASQSMGAMLDEQSARAYQAARAGMEWGLYQQLRNGACNPSTSFALPAGSTLSAFTVTVTCTASATAVASVVMYRIDVTACNYPTSASGTCPGSPTRADYVERRLHAML